MRQGLEVGPKLEQGLSVQPGMRFPHLTFSCFDSGGFQARSVSGGFQGSPCGRSCCPRGCSHPRVPTEGVLMFLTLISRRLIISSPNYPLKFRLPEFSPGGYYSGKFHQNPFSVCEFAELGGRWEESRAYLHLCFGSCS